MPDTADTFKKFLADVIADGVPSEVIIVRLDDGEEWLGGDFE